MAALWRYTHDIIFNKCSLIKSEYNAFKNSSPLVKCIKIIYALLNIATLGLFSLITIPLKIFIPVDIESQLCKESKEDNPVNEYEKLNAPLFSS